MIHTLSEEEISNLTEKYTKLGWKQAFKVVVEYEGELISYFSLERPQRVFSIILRTADHRVSSLYTVKYKVGEIARPHVGCGPLALTNYNTLARFTNVFDYVPDMRLYMVLYKPAKRAYLYVRSGKRIYDYTPKSATYASACILLKEIDR